MKKPISCAIAVFCLFCAGCATWTQGDYALAGAGLAAQAVDWRQTRTIAGHPDQWYEINPLLGDHPDSQDVDAYFAVSAALRLLVAHALPHGAWRTAWLGGCAGVSAGLVAHNYQLGVHP